VIPDGRYPPTLPARFLVRCILLLLRLAAAEFDELDDDGFPEGSRDS